MQLWPLALVRFIVLDLDLRQREVSVDQNHLPPGLPNRNLEANQTGWMKPSPARVNLCDVNSVPLCSGPDCLLSDQSLPVVQRLSQSSQCSGPKRQHLKISLFFNRSAWAQFFFLFFFLKLSLFGSGGLKHFTSWTGKWEMALMQRREAIRMFWEKTQSFRWRQTSKHVPVETS